jgi:Zn-finger protein
VEYRHSHMCSYQRQRLASLEWQCSHFFLIHMQQYMEALQLQIRMIQKYQSRKLNLNQAHQLELK